MRKKKAKDREVKATKKPFSFIKSIFGVFEKKDKIPVIQKPNPPIVKTTDAKKKSSPTKRKTRNVKYQMNSNLRNEIVNLINSRTSKLTQKVINKNYRETMLTSFELFDKHVADTDPTCERTSLSCYKNSHAKSFKLTLYKEDQVSPLTGEQVSKGYLAGIATRTRIIFNYAVEAGLIETSPFSGIMLPRYKSKSRTTGYIEDVVIEEITRIDLKATEKMTPEEEYIYALPRVAVKICYEGAMRSCEIVNLCIEDIDIVNKRPSGLIAIKIVAGKQRMDDHVDIVWVMADRIEPHLNYWLKVRKRYLHSKSTEDIYRDMPKRKDKGHPDFVHPKTLELLDEKASYKQIFKNLLDLNEKTKLFSSRTHILRQSRITNWVKEGWDFYDVHKNARHAKFEETENYFKGNAEDRAIRIENNLKLNKTPELQNQNLPEESVILYIVFKFIEMIRKENTDILNQDLTVSSIFRGFYNYLNKIVDSTDIGNYYTIKDLCTLWDLKSTQVWKRIKTLQNDKYLHLAKSKNGVTIIPKLELDDFNTRYIEFSRAIQTAGITKKGHINYIRKLCKKGRIDAIKVSKLWFLSRTSFDIYMNKQRKKDNA